jgi:hypothetical protein
VACSLSPYKYAISSRLKYDVARYHLNQFRRVLPEVPQIVLFFRLDQDHGLAVVWAHSDGCVSQLFAAFDAYACAVAHQFGLRKTDRASFKRIAADKGLTSTPEEEAVAGAIEAVVASSQYQDLDGLRNTAGHRGVVGRSLRADTDPGIRVFLEPDASFKGEGTEVLPTLESLVAWAETPLRELWDRAEAWRQDHEPSVKGTPGDLDGAALWARLGTFAKRSPTRGPCSQRSPHILY